MRILIPGVSGLVGLNLAIDASNALPNTRLDRVSAAYEPAQREYVVIGVVNRHRIQTDFFQVVEADLLVPGTIERLVDQFRPDWIINCAALALLDECEADPPLAEQINTHFPSKLAALAHKRDIRLMHLSTDTVFDGVRGDYTEEDQPNPLSVYARTKLAGERAVADANPNAIISRVNLFGWSLSGKRNLAEWFFYNLQSGKQVMGFTDIYYCPLFVNDLAQLLLKMLENGLRGLYHVVSSQCSSKYDFAVALAERFNLDAGLVLPTSVNEADLAAQRSPRLILRSDKLAKALGQSIPGITSGLEKFVYQYQHGYPQTLRKMAIAPIGTGKNDD
jgi:dTDP-4-dehydrorhamnose reductase